MTTTTCPAARRSTSAKLEVHEHSYIHGPNARFAGLSRSHLIHSHEGGDKPHVHKNETHETGCGSYTIDKDEWYARTGLRGGGRKKFTVKATGQQMPLVAIEPPAIRVFVVGDGGVVAAGGASGPGDAPIHRMILGCKSRVSRVARAAGGSL